ncbi:MAG: membrane protein insertion efficiency factor YidD [Planctomycetota bacterium]|jgi:putative component of membrane protein insertase Oxa1/YidC/SpoIIIJ protein YidD
MLTTGPALLLIRLYQLTLARVIGNSCRFHPSCSRYSVEARLARCQPFGGYGHDPVPSRFLGAQALSAGISEGPSH